MGRSTIRANGVLGGLGPIQGPLALRLDSLVTGMCRCLDRWVFTGANACRVVVFPAGWTPDDGSWRLEPGEDAERLG